MSLSWRALGSVGLVATALLLWRGSIGKGPDSDVGASPPPGFLFQAHGLGEVETSFEGPFRVELAQGGDGGGGLLVEGEDPRPLNEGMRLNSPWITAPATPPSRGFIAHGTGAWIPLRGGGITLDTSRPWKIEDMVLTLDSLEGGAGIRISSSEAWLDTRTGDSFCPGPFQVDGSGLHVQGEGLELDADSDIVRLGATSTRTTWEFPGTDGESWKGTANGPGTLAPREGGGRVLSFPEGTECQVFLPPESGWAGEWTTQGIEFQLREGEAGLRPLQLKGLGATRWHGEGRSLEGVGGLIRWTEDGSPGNLILDGPVHAVAQEEEVSLRAEERAEALPNRGALSLHGGVAGTIPGGAVQAKSASWIPGEKIQFLDASLFPESADIPKVSARQISFDSARQAWASGRVVTEGGNAIEGGDPEPWVLESDALVLDGRREKWRLEASGNVVFREGAYRARAHRIEKTEGGGAVFFGEPRVEWTGYLPQWTLRATAGRSLLSQERLALSRRPILFLPADNLRLVGDVCEVNATFIEFLPGGTWEATGPLTFSGAWQGRAESARWTSKNQLELAGGRSPLHLQGVEQLWGAFEVTGKRAVFSKESTLLSGNASCRFEGGPEQGPLFIRSQRIEWGEGGGAAEGQVRVEGLDWTAFGDSLDWHGEGAARVLVLRGDVSLESEFTRATGRVAHFLETVGEIEVQGDSDCPATLKLEDGRTAVGQRFVHRKGVGVLEAGDATFVIP